MTSPARTARDTALALNVEAGVEAALQDSDHGEWTGRPFAEIPPDMLGSWLADPTQAVPGGESMEAVRQRVGAWMDDAADRDGAMLAITHPGVIRAALSHALSIPLPATLAIDVAPLSATRLSFNRIWRLQSTGPVDEVD